MDRFDMQLADDIEASTNTPSTFACDFSCFDFRSSGRQRDFTPTLDCDNTLEADEQRFAQGSAGLSCLEPINR
jgi:hypothetical protein